MKIGDEFIMFQDFKLALNKETYFTVKLSVNFIVCLNDSFSLINTLRIKKII